MPSFTVLGFPGQIKANPVQPQNLVLKIALSPPQIYRHSAGSDAATVKVTLLLLCLQFAIQMAEMT